MMFTQTAFTISYFTCKQCLTVSQNKNKRHLTNTKCMCKQYLTIIYRIFLLSLTNDISCWCYQYFQCNIVLQNYLFSYKPNKCNTGKYSPPFCFRPFRPRCQWANLSLTKFQCLKLSFFGHIYVRAN